MIALSAILFTACNNNGGKKEQEGQNMSKDTIRSVNMIDDKDIKAVAVTFASMDTKATASVKKIVEQYLHIKNALANDNGSEAASGAKAMSEILSETDKSFFTSEQKKVYGEIEEDLKEHAEHIGKNGDNIKHQREHFSMMSEDIYDLVKAFGAGQPIYHYHCPMYNENKGAMWLSEMKEVRNPYFGAEMLHCGSVEEVIK